MATGSLPGRDRYLGSALDVLLVQMIRKLYVLVFDALAVRSGQSSLVE